MCVFGNWETGNLEGHGNGIGMSHIFFFLLLLLLALPFFSFLSFSLVH